MANEGQLIHRFSTSLTIQRLGSSLLLLATALYVPVLADGAEQKVSSEANSVDPQFAFSTGDISDRLVTVSCENGFGNQSFNGYIACMDGETYLFTRQSILYGAKKITFKTFSGTTLHPSGVELSVSRDIARLPLGDETSGFVVADEIIMNSPICIPENFVSEREVKKCSGTIIGVGPDTVEVSAKFDLRNSGSPVLNPKQEVLALTGYVKVPNKAADFRGTRFENSTRRFCYRIANARWKQVNWQKYNAKYGNFYFENAAFTEQADEIVSSLYHEPMGKIYTKKKYVETLSEWRASCNQLVGGRHNRLVGKHHDRLQYKQEFSAEYVACINKLSKLCESQLKGIHSFLERQNPSDFLRRDLEQQIKQLGYMIQRLNHVRAYGKDYRYDD